MLLFSRLLQRKKYSTSLQHCIFNPHSSALMRKQSFTSVRMFHSICIRHGTSSPDYNYKINVTYSTPVRLDTRISHKINRPLSSARIQTCAAYGPGNCLCCRVLTSLTGLLNCTARRILTRSLVKSAR